MTRLRKFIEKKDPMAVQQTAKELLLGGEKLKVFSELGLKVERAFKPNRIRDLFIGKYTIRYLIGENEVVVLRLWHGKQLEKDV